MATKIALFDLDGTLADYDGQMRIDLESIMSPGDHEFDMRHPPAWAKARMDIIKRQPGWWFNLPRYEPGFDILRAAMSIGFEPYVLTKGPYNTTSAWTEKVEWCRVNLPKEVKVTITEDKSGTYGRVLVDDWIPFMEGWLAHRPRGLGIIPAHDHNGEEFIRLFEQYHVVRYTGTPDNLEAVRKSLLWAFNREDGST